MSHTNYIKSLIGLLTTLILTTLVSVNSQAQTTCTTNALGDRTCTTVTSGTTTGNILDNSTFGTGNTTTTTDWSTTGSDGIHTHGNFGNFPYQSGMDQTGGVLAFEGHTEDNVYQDQSLVGDGHLTKSQINEGFTSTQSADVWFWNMIENTLTLKQTITAADGTVTTQTRTINDHDPNRNFNGGTFENYTNVYTHSANTQNDFTIRTELYNQGDGSNNDNYHRGPDVDNVQLSITTAGTTTVVVTPCFVLNTCTTIGEDIDEAVNLETDDGIDLFQDIDTKVEDAIQEFEDSQFTDSFNFDTQIEILVEDDIGNIEFQPLDVYIEESFTDFLETNNLVETFQQELVFEDISEEEFYNELTSVVSEELSILVAPDEMYETDSTNFENINYDETVMIEPSMDVRMETDIDFMPEPDMNMESDEFYMTESEMETFIEENPNMIEYADENTIVLRPPNEMEDYENYDDTVMTQPEMSEEMMEEPEMIEEEILDGPPRMTEMKEEEMSNDPQMQESIEEEPTKEEVKEEEIKEEKPKEESNESTEPKTNTNEEVKEESNETTEERESGESVSNESEMAEDKETEGTKEEETNDENVEDEAIESNEQKNISVKENSISVKVQKVLDKVLSKLKRVDQKLQAIQMVTSKGITTGEADISGYINKRIYTNQVKLNGVPNADFFENLNILEQQQIYKDANLAAYTSNDPIAVKQKLLQEINVDKNRLLLEIKMLKEG